MQQQRYQVDEIYQRINETERQISSTSDPNVADNLQQNLQHCSNQSFRMEGNYQNLVEEFERFRDDILYKVSIIDSIIGV